MPRKSLFRPARKMFAGVAILALAGCAAPRGDELPKTTNFSATGARDGLVIFGINSSHNLGGHYEIYWQRVDLAAKRYSTNPNQGKQISMVLSETIWRKPTPLPRHFFVFQVPPGTYGLKNMKHIGPYLHLNIRFQPSTLAFEVKRGEVLYVGNFLVKWDKCWNVPARFCFENTRMIYGNHDLAEAKAELSKYKNINGEPRFYELKRFDQD